MSTPEKKLAALFIINELILQELEKELEMQLCMKQEMEIAMKLLEKDIHEKQDTMVSLRRQLEDIKAINLEMYKKLQVIKHLKVARFNCFQAVMCL